MQKRRLIPFLSAAFLGLTIACGGDSPTGPDDGGGQPTTRPEFDMTVKSRYVRASSQKSCDGDGILGGKNAGEYQFRITARSGSDNRSYETNNYGKVTGTNMKLEAGETGNFADQSWTFSNLSSAGSATLTLYVTEWDGLDKDDYMDNLNRSVTLSPSKIRPNGGTDKDRQLSVGTSTCGLTLFYDVSVTKRDVPAN